MKHIQSQKRSPAQITILTLLSLGLVAFSIVVDLAGEIIEILHPYMTYPLMRTLVNAIFVVLLGLIFFAYREWRYSNARERELSAVIDGISPDTLLVADSQGKIQLVNRSAERMFGYSQSELAGIPMRKLISEVPTDVGELPGNIESLRDDGFLIGLSKATRKDGSEFPAEVISARLDDNLGEAFLVRDITEKIDFQDKIFEYKTRLEELVEERTRELRQTRDSLEREIDEHRDSKSEIQKLAQFHKSIIDNAKIWMNVIDREANIVLWNRAAEEISGYRREEVAGNSSIWGKVYDPETGERVKSHVIEAMKNETEIDEFETTILSKRGDEKTLSWSSRLLKGNDGVVSGSLYIGREVTCEKVARAQAEKRLSEMKFLSENSLAFMETRSEEALNELLIEGLAKLSPSSIILVNSLDEATSEFRISASRNAETARKIIQKNLGIDALQASFKIDDDFALRNLLSGRLVRLPGIGDISTLSFGKIPREFSEILEREFDLGYIYSIGFSFEGQLFGSTTIITKKGEDIDNADIIETLVNQAAIALQRIRAESRLIEAKQIAEKANFAKTQFLANMSHELRTPLSGLMGMTELALRTELPRETRENMRLAHQSAGDLLRIVNNILDLSKIEAGEMKLVSEPFSIRRIVTSIRNKMIVLARKKGIKFTVQIPSNVPDCIFGDGYRLEQVLMNLVSNAIKFTDEGSVSFAVSKLESDDPSMVVLKFDVIDTGIGIPPEKLDMIFESYQQADSSIKHKKGTGLGIAIAKSIVILMNGDIEVESEPEKGSKFHFTLAFPTSEREL
ncbi:MAG TPA: PAS domain S-box protein [candidate division Zixibacteria bacterium]|nr:PAS domain S-box protein [candidate division Zixibacteria bacterium]